MAVKVYRCQVTEVRHLDGDIAVVRFRPQVAFRYEPGQFLSLQVPDRSNPSNMLWRAYSFSVPPEMARKDGYELCIRKMPNGQAAAYVEKLRPGDWIKVRASYGEFTLRSKPGRGVCMIGTGTGIAPLRSIGLSREFQERELSFAIAILGYRLLKEVPFAGDFERAGIATTYALSDATEPLSFPFFNGRVTDVLKTLRSNFPWHQTDFYMCGNGHMILDVIRFLRGSKGVEESAIFAEAFLPAKEQDEAA